MKNLFFVVIMSLMMLQVQAQVKKEIKLQPPNLERTATLMKAFKDRQSIREYSDKDLSIADLSDLLWSANGFNRPEKNLRTAASTANKQDIDIYVVTRDGAYLYDARNNVLSLLTEGDYRNDVANGQDFAATAPISLVLVSDLSHFGENAHIWGAIDAGIVSANIYMFCAGANLGTVTRGSANSEKLRQILKLTGDQRIFLSHPVGYLK